MIFKNFEYFRRIAERQSVSKAAEELYVSQPSLSKYIKRLESSLEIELFDHTSSPLRLTYAGERYLHYINQYLSLEAQIKKEFLEIKAKSRGKIVIGIGQWTASMLIPSILPHFWEKHPDIEVILREGSQAFLTPLIENNKIDFCITNLPMSYKDISYEIVMLEPILLAINSNNPILEKLGLPSRFDINNIAHLDFTKTFEQLFILPQNQNLTVQVMSFFNKYSFRPKKVFETESIPTALGLVSAGTGVTFVPFRGVCFQKLPMDLTFFTVGEPINAWNLGVAYKSGAFLNHQARLFIDHLKDCLQKYKFFGKQ